MPIPELTDLAKKAKGLKTLYQGGQVDDDFIQEALELGVMLSELVPELDRFVTFAEEQIRGLLVYGEMLEALVAAAEHDPEAVLPVLEGIRPIVLKNESLQ